MMRTTIVIGCALLLAAVPLMLAPAASAENCLGDPAIVGECDDGTLPGCYHVYADGRQVGNTLCTT